METCLSPSRYYIRAAYTLSEHYERDMFIFCAIIEFVSDLARRRCPPRQQKRQSSPFTRLGNNGFALRGAMP